MRDIELLQYIHKTAQMGVVGLRDVEPLAHDPALREAIAAQIREYRDICADCAALLKSRGEQPADPGLMARVSSQVMSAAKTAADSSASKLAEMVIQGNTMGITKSIRHLHDYAGDDPQVRSLAEKLLKTEQANVEQMKKFL